MLSVVFRPWRPATSARDRKPGGNAVTAISVGACVVNWSTAPMQPRPTSGWNCVQQGRSDLRIASPLRSRAYRMLPQRFDRETELLTSPSEHVGYGHAVQLLAREERNEQSWARSERSSDSQ